jgi:hypothetical protein
MTGEKKTKTPRDLLSLQLGERKSVAGKKKREQAEAARRQRGVRLTAEISLHPILFLFPPTLKNRR